MSRKLEEKRDIPPVADDEIFEDVVGYSHYRVSNYGRVFSDNKELKAGKNENGYSIVSIISDDGRRVTCRVHRLVYSAFNGVPYDEFRKNAMTIDHIDTNKDNNRLSNLRLITRGENTSKAWRENLHTDKIRAVNQYSLDGKYIKTFDSLAQAALSVGRPETSGCAIGSVCSKSQRGNRNLYLYGYQWRYYNGDTSDIGPATSSAPIKTYLDQYTMDGVFIKRWRGYDAAAAGVGLKSVQSLYQIFSGKAKSAGGYLWRRVEIPESEYV